MRFRSIPWLLFIVAATPSLGAEPGLGLDEVFQAALRRADSVAVSGELVRQAEEQYKQAFGAMLPTINASYVVTRQKPIHNAFGASLAPAYQPLAKITATQLLFVGLRDQAVKRQTEGGIAASKLDRDQAVVQLYKDTATNFYSIGAAEQDIANVNTELDHYRRRIDELDRFRKIGRSQITDVLTAQAAQATLRATVRQLAGQVAAARQVMSVTTGLAVSTPLKFTLSDTLPRDLESVEVIVQRLDQRPDIAAALVRNKTADEGIQVARAGHLPTVSLSADYYLQRVGTQKDVTWDVMLAATLPIYGGGIVTSQVDAATSVVRQSNSALSLAKRSAEEEIRSDYAIVLADKEQLGALKIATDLAQQNYEAQIKNFRLGLVTNLDVLSALTSFQENQRALDRQRFTLALDVEKIQIAAAQRPRGLATTAARSAAPGEPG